MKSISIKEPWLGLIVEGQKLYETRTWKTSYTGDLLLCGSKNPKDKYAGKAACVVRMTGCRPMTEKDEFLARCPYEPGRYVWILSDIREVKPFEVKGRLSFFDVPDDKIKYI